MKKAQISINSNTKQVWWSFGQAMLTAEELKEESIENWFLRLKCKAQRGEYVFYVGKKHMIKKKDSKWEVAVDGNEIKIEISGAFKVDLDDRQVEQLKSATTYIDAFAAGGDSNVAEFEGNKYDKKDGFVVAATNKVIWDFT